MSTYPPYQLPADITATLVRAVPVSTRRERRIYTTHSPRGHAVMIRDHKRGDRGEMEPVGAPFFIFDREAPDVLAALGEAVAAIGAAAASPTGL